MAELVRPLNRQYKYEANQLSSENAEAVAAWCGGLLVTEHDALDHDVTYAGINVPTKDGMRRAQEGDWIIKLFDDTFIVVKFDQFWQLYEMVEDP